MQAGQIVGDTRSGKPIFAFYLQDKVSTIHPQNSDFSKEDHFDAMSVFEVLSIRARSKYGQRSAERVFYREQASLHAKFLKGDANLKDLMTAAGCRDAFDMAKFGRLLCRREFQDR